ncbi:MAG: purine-nucleoside phosphorylase [Alphaproteobacteria bacterium]|nr:purine-nucleoside phosphorylase [Alphaproteobacteria bacterium]
MPQHAEDILKQVDAATQALQDRFGPPPDAVILLGSGLGGLRELLAEPDVAPYASLGLPPTSVVGHAGELVVGAMGRARVALLAGRVHAYEGRPIDEVVRAVRAVARWGVKRVILTSAVGSIAPGLAPGDLFLIRDHINLMGVNPLYGPQGDLFGARHPDLTRLYDPGLAARVAERALALGLTLHQGVYGAMPGPSYETPAEIRMLRTLGADVVGMSMVPEVLALSQFLDRLQVLAFAMVSNLGAGLGEGPLEHEDVLRSVDQARGHLEPLLLDLVERVA